MWSIPDEPLAPTVTAELEITADQLLAELAQHPSYSEALARTKERMEMEFRRLAARLAKGDEIPHGEIQWIRGWYACMKALLDQPRFAQAKIERERAQTERKEPD